MPPFEEKDGRVIMSAERFAITPNEGSKEAKMAQDNERPPLTAEAFDAMLEQSAAFRHLWGAVSALGATDAILASRMDVLDAASRREREGKHRAAADMDMAAKISGLEQ